MVKIKVETNDNEKGLKGHDLLTLLNYTLEEISYLLNYANQMRKDMLAGKMPLILAEKTLKMIFETHSTRTRISFEVGMNQLGVQAMFMNARDMQIARGKSVYDTGNVLSKYLDGVMIRANSHEMGKARSDYMFLHFLPAYREEEVATSVIDGPNSYIFQQAGNRLHA